MDWEVWTARLRDFLNDCVGSDAAEESDRIREAGLLLQGTPLGMKHELDLNAIEAMLASGAAESAVLAILGPDIAFMLSRGGSGSCLATVVMDDESEEMISEGATVALALLAAHVSLLLARLEFDGQDLETIEVPPAARLH
ncbi:MULTISPECIES: hypothetical protein [Novosphingobium]|uniref:Uncharacterized protein n=1 Tax=Novosphingobium mathurense TaxID=428990 RepID=A0A1U6HHI0_9SPHN|nr:MULTISPECIES: hypothetical protein [Novosphingobium]CDO35555.1 hypothetical protein SPHV1_2260047 [Novosphingobium sp. KN65.2]SLJ95285.1 hypothetical protein SAMN06295987_102435 [Novosphingobium mathurense]